MNISSVLLRFTIINPEAYIPSGDVYIEKEATINDELDRLRLSATRSLFERRDCVIVASVSCIYGLGSPDAYYGMLLMLEKGQKIERQEITSRLVDILYERHEGDPKRGTFRVRGDVIEVFPTYDDYGYRVSLWGDEIESLEQIDPLTGQVKQTYLRLPIYPKTHYVMSPETRAGALRSIENELTWWKGELEKQGQRIEAQRVYQRTMFDLEMIRQIGYCHGIENYSRHFSGRLPGQAPPTLPLIICRKTRCSLSTKATRPSRSLGACIMATVPGRRRSVKYGFPSRRAPWTTGR